MRIKFDLEKGKVDIRGPDPEALLGQLEEFGGLLVDSGQLVELELDDDEEDGKFEIKVKKDGTIEVEGWFFELLVTCTDASENEAEVTVTPVFLTGEHEHDGEHDHEHDD